MAKFFQRLFGRQPISEQDGEKAAQSETQASPGLHAPSFQVAAGSKSLLGLPQLIAGCSHSVGKQRDQNEDSLFTLTTVLVADSTRVKFGLYIIADGMGGHKHGEVASGIAVRAMANQVIRKVYLPHFNLTPTPPEQSLQEIMQEGIQAAHRAILKETPGGGTTLTAALVLGDQMTIAHAGDSRAYLIQSDGALEVLTRDHSLVKRLEELGQLTPEEAAVHPQRNVLYRALGQGEQFDAEILTMPLPEAGHLLICSDGLWGLVSEAEIVRMVNAAAFPAEACQSMVDAANDAGGPDNISVILVLFPGG